MLLSKKKKDQITTGEEIIPINPVSLILAVLIQVFLRF